MIKVIAPTQALMRATLVRTFRPTRCRGCRGEPVAESLRVMHAQPQRYAEAGLSTVEIRETQRRVPSGRARRHVGSSG